MGSRLLVGLVLAPPVLVAGLVTGVASIALHGRWWGLLLVVTAVGTTVAALPRRWWGRPVFVLGWEVVVLRAGVARGPGGDVVVTADVAGYALLVLALVVAVATLVTLPARPRGSGGESGPDPGSA